MGPRPGWGAWTSQHESTAQPPAQPGSIWVASGRSTAEPAAAKLGQDPPLPMPHTFTQKLLQTPSGPPPGLSTTLVSACMGCKKNVYAHASEVLDEPSLRAWRDKLCIAGPT